MSEDKEIMIRKYLKEYPPAQLTKEDLKWAGEQITRLGLIGHGDTPAKAAASYFSIIGTNK